jgi:hypothetical protein
VRGVLKDSQRNIDLKEIFSHIEQLKLERQQVEDIKKEDLKHINIIKDNIGIITGKLENIRPEDIFEIVSLVEKDSEETITVMKVDANSSGKCDICGKKIKFEKNHSGLIIHESYIACRKCCNESSKDELNIWAELKKKQVQKKLNQLYYG